MAQWHASHCNHCGTVALCQAYQPQPCLTPVAKRMLRVRVSAELWRATHIEALNKGVNVGVVVEDALKLYFALAQDKVSIVPKPGASLDLVTIKPSTATAQCEQATTSPPVAVKEPAVQPQPAAIVDAEAPSFVKGNPWLEIIARRNGG